jgi:DNA-binding NarL/FixJ family response regulator
MNGMRVIVADDSPQLLAAVGDLLGALGHDVVAMAATGDEAVSAAISHDPEVVVVDVEMPGGGPDLVRRLRRLSPAPRVLALSGHDEPDVAVAMIRAGAGGYVAKGALRGDLDDALRSCADGETVVLAACADDVRTRLGEGDVAPDGGRRG